jgi:transcriptional regulator with XRE-family HTH domain
MPKLHNSTSDFEDFNYKQATKKIGRKIAVFRTKQKISREKLALKLNISHQQLFKYEMGQSRITVDRLIAIAEALDLKILDFFTIADFEKVADVDYSQNLEEKELLKQILKLQNIPAKNLVKKVLDFLLE